MSSLLKEWRHREGLSLRELAGLTGVSVPMLSQVENGQRAMSRHMKIKISRALRTPVDELFEIAEIADEQVCMQ